MPLVKTVALPDGGQHFFFDCGGGNCWRSSGGRTRRPRRRGPPRSDFPAKPMSAVGSMNHVAFTVAEDERATGDRLGQPGVRLPEVVNHDDSEWAIADEMHPGVFVRSVYFHDPDGILLEFAALDPRAGAGRRAPRARPAPPTGCRAERRCPACARCRGPRPRSRSYRHVRPALRRPRPGGRARHRRPAPPATGGRCSPLSPDVFEHAVQRLRPLPEPGAGRSTRCCASWARPASAGPRRASSSSRSTASRCAASASPRTGSPRSRTGRWPTASIGRARGAGLRRLPGATTAAACRTGVRRAEGALSDEQILELTYIVASTQHAVMSRALRTEFDDRPEPVVEVVDPEPAPSEPPA